MSLSAQRRGRRLSMTSLIDVIFLLLLFFMLSSTFSRFAEVELTVAGQAGAAQAPPARVLFLRVSAQALSFNGAPVVLGGLDAALDAETEAATLLVSVTADVSAQRLTDVLVGLRSHPHLAVSVLGGA